MPDVDISIVTYQTEPAQLRVLVASIAESACAALRLNLFIHDNSPGEAPLEPLRPELEALGAFARIELHGGGGNLGFGRGHNANAALGHAALLLVVNPDCALEPGALALLVDTATADDPRVAAWEMRQIPYEHPKAYDPVTLDTPWTSGAATLYRRAAFEAVGGFDPAIFLYGEDVDLSWRLRARGARLRYIPRAAAVHRAYAAPAEVKPQQAYGAVYASLALRTRYGGARSIVKGLAMLGAEILAPDSFPGRRRGMVATGVRYLANAPHFLRTRVRPTAAFQPQFSGWGYEFRRDGAFHAMASRRDASPGEFPRVSVLVRTVDRPAWLRQALASCAHQTYPNLEVVVVEDGTPASRAVVEEFSHRLDVRYLATGERVGRARAGNAALRAARGEWLNFLDDDDVLFADHVEVLVAAARAAGARAAYAYAWESRTEVVDHGRAAYVESANVPRHRCAFDRPRLWHENFLPIQSVLFHRSLWERYGGFAEDMEALEDWNLWTRYSLEDDFIVVPKTTSKYRVPGDPRAAAERQARLDRAYLGALERQRALRRMLPASRLADLDAAIARRSAGNFAPRGALKRLALSIPLLARMAAWRQPTLVWLRRRGLLQ